MNEPQSYPVLAICEGWLVRPVSTPDQLLKPTSKSIAQAVFRGMELAESTGRYCRIRDAVRVKSAGLSLFLQRRWFVDFELEENWRPISTAEARNKVLNALQSKESYWTDLGLYDRLIGAANAGDTTQSLVQAFVEFAKQGFGKS